MIPVAPPAYLWRCYFSKYFEMYFLKSRLIRGYGSILFSTQLATLGFSLAIIRIPILKNKRPCRIGINKPTNPTAKKGADSIYLLNFFLFIYFIQVPCNYLRVHIPPDVLLLQNQTIFCFSLLSVLPLRTTESDISNRF